MQRKACVTGATALLAVLLAGCTGGSDDAGTADEAKNGEAGTASVAAQPGKYRTLPEACGAVSQSTLDSLLPGIKQITDTEQRAKAYEGEATLTYDTDRRVGCRWKVASTDATDHLSIDLERVVSYDNAVSDDNQAHTVFATKQDAADLPEPAPTTTESANEQTESGSSGSSDETGGTDDSGKGGDATGSGDGTSATPTPSATGTGDPSGDPGASSSPSSSPSASATDLQPRVLDGLGDEAFLDDQLGSAGSTAQQRTVTVAFRTSNVIVTIEYEEQPATIGVTPDSEQMQDRARKLAAQLVGTLSE
ncbi:DUF3558 domain-containing protein [Streptomyces sp. NPDC090306]|uniref:DUF3558 domain-containing protein n=1 Tax=Streptomyces sp. NPDC090306 TaxID=3365961 RepID=UPI00381814C1